MLSLAVRRVLWEGLDSVVKADSRKWSLAKMIKTGGEGIHRKEIGGSFTKNNI